MQHQDLTQGSIPKLIRYLAVPASVGFLFNTLYNITDTYYAGLFSSLGQSALSISFPVFFIIIAIGSGISSGTTALMGHALGENNHRHAASFAIQAISFALIVGVLITILGYVISPFLFGILGAQGNYLNLALSYMNVLYLGAIFFTLTFTLNGILNAVGDTKSFSNVLIVGFFLNVVLSPAFMFGWSILPKLDLAGVAAATLVTEFVTQADPHSIWLSR